MDKPITPEERAKHVHHSLKAWAEAKAYTLEGKVIATEHGLMYPLIYNKDGKSVNGPDISNLDWWREVPISSEGRYLDELCPLLDIEVESTNPFSIAEIVKISNATIPQRMEALYNADNK